jgi:hypothetical protein
MVRNDGVVKNVHLLPIGSFDEPFSIVGFDLILSAIKFI